MNFLQKLNYMMEKHSLNKNTFSKACNIPYTTINNWYKRGYEGLKLETVRKLAQFFDTSLDYWFLDNITDENYGKVSGFEIKYEEMEHIKKYRTLDTHGKEMVDFTLDKEYERCAELKAQRPDISKQRYAMSELNAAHERTDIKITNEMKQYDDDIMDDDDF